jgi:uncharacterized delta-60 repeat protein
LLSAGAPDTSFGVGGAAFGELFPGGGASAAALQSNGQIIAAGNGITSGFNHGLALARFNSNGLLDRTFGVGGKVLTNLGTPIEDITAAAVQSDGKIVVAGYSESNQGSASSIVVLRYLSTGALDTTFGTKGIATISFLGFDFASAMVIQPNGSIVVGGTAQKSNAIEPPAEFALARLTSAGKLDATFGSGGKVLTAFTASGGGIDSLLLQSNGDLIATGSTDTGKNTYYVTLARYLASGALDSTFGSHGIVKSSAVPAIGQGGLGGGTFSQPVVATLQSNGKIDVATGGSVIEEPYSASNTLYVERFNTNGSIDTTFGKSGLASYSNGLFISPSTVMVQKNGDIVVAATSNQETPVNGIAEFLYVRFSTAGVRGTVTLTPMADSATSGGDGVDQVGAAIQQPNQDIVFVGASEIGTAGGDFALARYTLAGALDATFGYHGTVQQPNGITGLVNAIAEQSNGKILVAGTEQSPDPATQPTDAAIARYNANGTLDTTFGTDGRMYFRIGNNATWNSIKIQSNGDIVVGGSGQVGTTTEFALARYLPSGAFDTSFGSGGVVYTSFVSGGSQVCNSIAIQSNGDIVAAGTLLYTGISRFAVARYLPNGALDSTFGSGGKQTFTFSAGQASIASVAILKNNDILLAGTIGNDIALEALLPKGTIDTTFGTPLNGGLTPFHDGPIVVSSMAIDPATGDIVVGGTLDDTVSSSGGSDFALARFLPNGRLDTTFGTGGETKLYVDGDETLSSVAVASNSKIVVGGVTAGYGIMSQTNSAKPRLQGPPNLFATVARFNSNGSLDTTFGTGGLTTLDRGSGWNQTRAIVALQADGKILAADLDLHRLSAT